MGSVEVTLILIERIQSKFEKCFLCKRDGLPDGMENDVIQGSDKILI